VRRVPARRASARRRGPDAGGGRGSLPRSRRLEGAPPDGSRGLRGAFGVTRRLDLAPAPASLAGLESARLVGGAAGAQPRPPPASGPRLLGSSCGRTASLQLVEMELVSRLERCSDARDGSSEIAEHELRADADDAKARALQLAIAACIRGLLARVNGAIDLDDELDAWR